MVAPYVEVDQYMLASAFKKAARQYLYNANRYIPEDGEEILLDVWDELNADQEEGHAMPRKLGDHDEWNDPAGILRALDSLVEEFRRAEIIEPELQKIVGCVRNLTDQEIDDAENKEDDLLAFFSRKVLAAVGEPVPGRMRVMLTNWGFLSPK